VTPTDELWIDMAQFDTEIADGLWDGQLPADAPAWCSDFASLIGAARGPATDDELAAEDMIVSRMAEAILEAASGEPPTDEELFLTPPPVDPSSDEELLDDELELVFVSADGPDSGEIQAVDITEAESTVSEDTQAPDTDGPADGTKVNGTKVNGTTPSLTIVPMPAEHWQAEAGAPSAEDTPPADDEPTDETPGDQKVAALAPRPLIGGRRRPAGKRSGGPRHLAPKREDDGTGRFRLVRRVVAVKAVATTTAVAIGITAAAAATGVVVTVVDPPKWPGSSSEEAEPSTVLPPAMTTDLGRPPRTAAQPSRPSTRQSNS
jgi:hypothetical protein